MCIRDRNSVYRSTVNILYISILVSKSINYLANSNKPAYAEAYRHSFGYDYSTSL